MAAASLAVPVPPVRDGPPVAALPALPALPARLRELAAAPAVVRARPAILAALALLAVAVLWLALRAPDWRPLYGELSDGDKSAVLAALEAGNYSARVNPDTGAVEVASGDAAAARILLAGQGLPKSARALDPVGDMPLGLSRAVEAARLKSATEVELARSIEAIDGVKRATLHIAVPEPSVFVRDKAPPSASVFVGLAPGRVLGEAQVRAIVWLVSSSVPGLAPDRVSVVDQSGALLSAGAGESVQLGYQVKVEGLVRERLMKLLTPLVGAGRFTAEVAADVDFSQSEATSERVAPGVLKSEAASRAIDNSPAPARGIPGALSNTAPQAAQLSATPPAAAAAPPPGTSLTNETTNRAWDVGRDISVTRAGTPRLKRLSVAVVIDRTALRKATPADLAQLARIIRGAIGYDAARGDIVEVQLRGFAAEPAAPRAWYQQPVVEQTMPWALLGLGVVAVLAIGVLLFRRRRRAAALLAAATADAETGEVGVQAPRLAAGESRAGMAEAGAVAEAPGATAPATVDGGDLAAAPPPALVDYREKLGSARELVDSDADRATAVARQMLAAT